MRSFILTLIAFLAATALMDRTAAAQSPPAGTSERISGTIDQFDGQTLAVHALDGRSLSIAVPDGVRIGSVKDETLADIKPGDFVGSAAVKGRDGKLHAQEVHIFPEALRGTGEGHRPMAGPEQTMTNAAVDGIAASADGRTLTLKYPGGEQVIEVSPGVRVVLMVPGDKSLLKPGAAVVVLALKAEDGKLTARSVQAEKDGVKPLM
jgi:hypothetical protein